MRRPIPALALAVLFAAGAAALSGCRGGSASARRDDEGRPCRIEVSGRSGRYRARAEAGSSVAGDSTVECTLRWRKSGSLLWNPVGDVERVRVPGTVTIDDPLPDLVTTGDLVRLEVACLDASGSATWRSALEVRAP